MQKAPEPGAQPSRAPVRYDPPDDFRVTTLGELLQDTRRIPANQQRRFGFDEETGGKQLFCAGDMSLVGRPAVAIVGTRKPSPEGIKRAQRLARELVAANVVVVSGLADGIDTAALTAAMKAGGRTIGVIGTPLNKAYPADNKRLQEVVWREHLLISEFVEGSNVYPSNFPMRNRTMAAITDATAIIEAGNSSGTLHQADECIRLARPLFIAQSVFDRTDLTWPARFAKDAHVLRATADLLNVIGVG